MRKVIYAKTGGHCHLCGKWLRGRDWVADHIVTHTAGGRHTLSNYLPACRKCNRLKWQYGPKAFRKILQLGVYTQKEMSKKTQLGRDIARLLRRRSSTNELRRISAEGVSKAAG
jgi:5-methylcytosine-specific restriction endonuclease McrA